LTIIHNYCRFDSFFSKYWTFEWKLNIVLLIFLAFHIVSIFIIYKISIRICQETIKLLLGMKRISLIIKIMLFPLLKENYLNLRILNMILWNLMMRLLDSNLSMLLCLIKRKDLKISIKWKLISQKKILQSFEVMWMGLKCKSIKLVFKLMILLGRIVHLRECVITGKPRLQDWLHQTERLRDVTRFKYKRIKIWIII